LVEAVVRRLTAWGWLVAAEVSFSIYGERGSVDALAFHPTTRAALIVEVKSVVPDVQAMLASLDRKWRNGRAIARGRGWNAVAVARILVFPDLATPRRRVAAHEETFRAAAPMRGTELRRWMRQPEARAVSGIWFLSLTQADGAKRTSSGRERVRQPRPRTATRPTEAAEGHVLRTSNYGVRK
jgi:hypothetical protein